MSLNFGLYLVEQGIITCDQFCGLVKIQQETKTSLGNIAINKNIMTIKQVATVLEQLEVASSQSFIEVALKNDFIELPDAEKLLQLEQFSRPPLRQIIVNVELLTEEQVALLYQHYRRLQKRHNAAAAQGTTSTTTTPDTTKSTEPTEPAQTPGRLAPREPKFRQKPVFVQPDYTPTF